MTDAARSLLALDFRGALSANPNVFPLAGYLVTAALPETSWSRTLAGATAKIFPLWLAFALCFWILRLVQVF